MFETFTLGISSQLGPCPVIQVYIFLMEQTFATLTKTTDDYEQRSCKIGELLDLLWLDDEHKNDRDKHEDDDSNQNMVDTVDLLKETC